ncbi:MAG: type I pullulanase [Clostridium sp.]|nr:type I pullulanase [Clostridium sp.]
MTRQRFAIWSPDATGAELRLYRRNDSRRPYTVLAMERDNSTGEWGVEADVESPAFHTFRICDAGGRWLRETPSPRTRALAANSRRGAVVDFRPTDPPGWMADRGPRLQSPVDAVIAEIHVRDFSSDPSAGSNYPGLFSALAEANRATEWLRRMGYTHVQLMPVADFATIDELRRDPSKYNWGYDPFFHSVPEGSYSTDPRDPATRIREMKQMVKSLHDAGIGVIMDVVYNHVYSVSDSPLELTAPGRFFRRNPDGTISNGSGCGNEIASETPWGREFIKDSLLWWMRNYHIDGFRFDLMGCLDIETVNSVAHALRLERPDILLYGEGWTAGDSALPRHLRATAENRSHLDRIGMFSDRFRDLVRGDEWDSRKLGFVTGGAVDFREMSRTVSGGDSPELTVNYAGCHDGLTLADRILACRPDLPGEDRRRSARLAMALVMTSQGVPFVMLGDEAGRSKGGDRNSYRSPEPVNAIHWDLLCRSDADYVAALIRLRRDHPAFRLRNAADIRSRLRFDIPRHPGVFGYTIAGNAGSDDWSDIKLIFNGSDTDVTIRIPKADWIVIAEGDHISPTGLRRFAGGHLPVPARTPLILARR